MNDTPSPTARLHVLLTDPHSRGGGQVSYVTRLATELVRRGHRVTIGCRRGSVLVDAAREVGAEVLDRFHYARGLRLLKIMADGRTLARFLKRERPDILHVNGSQDHWNAAMVNAANGSPAALVRTRHNTYPVKENPANRLLNLQHTDYQVVVCEDVRRTLAAQPIFNAGRLCSVHNGVDAARFAPDPEARARARADLGYGDGDLVCGIAARLVKAKGHELLFRAFARVQDRFPSLRLLVLGQGVLEDELRVLTRELGMAERVCFAGFRDDMPACVQAMDFGVQPSVDCDTSSFSLKEQMAAAKPVIASDYGGLKEIVTDGVEGLVVPTGTVEPLAAALATLAADPDLRARLGAAGQARVAREFTVEVFAERTLAAYGRALEIHRERTAH